MSEEGKGRLFSDAFPALPLKEAYEAWSNPLPTEEVWLVSPDAAKDIEKEMEESGCDESIAIDRVLIRRGGKGIYATRRVIGSVGY